ncbi:MAG TPA: FkbM family methyltransferase [Acidimicrobiales bacterium]|nr:FkbM family methyltransferase [Acidimicrobiales bacterium]
MAGSPLVFYAQNGEDVVLWRALGHVEGGVYVDVGACDPVDDSVTKLFYDRGWRGLDVEPVAEHAQALRADRPRDVVAAVAVTGDDHGSVTLHEVTGTGLSTLSASIADEAAARGFATRDVTVPTRTLRSLVDEHLGDQDVHFCKIDVEGAEAEVIASVDLEAWRPWVLVVESTHPNTAEPTHMKWQDRVLAAGYRPCLFDGLSRFYVSEEHAAELGEKLSYPACPLDGYVHVSSVELRNQLEELQRSHHDAHEELGVRQRRIEALDREVEDLRHALVRWRRAAVESWAESVARGGGPATELQEMLDAMRETLPWRVIRRLRAVRSRLRSPR